MGVDHSVKYREKSMQSVPTPDAARSGGHPGSGEPPTVILGVLPGSSTIAYERSSKQSWESIHSDRPVETGEPE